MARIDKIVQRIAFLKPIAPVARQILAMAANPDQPLADMAQLIRHDAALTANLLKSCNAAAMGLVQPVDSVDQAVALLGLDLVVQTVMAQSVGRHLKAALSGYGLGQDDLWKQSVATALSAKSVAERHLPEDSLRIYTAGLLMDIGKVLLERHVRDKLRKIQHLVKRRGLGFDEAEKAVVGLDHAELGGMIAEQWGFSPRLVYMIRHHHLTDAAARQDRATGILYLADMVAMMVGIDIGVDRLAYPVYEEIFTGLVLAREDLKALMLAYHGHLQTAGQMLSLA